LAALEKHLVLAKYADTVLQVMTGYPDYHSEENCIIRNDSVHKNHVAAVLKDSRFVKTYGVKGESVFNDVANFSVSRCLPPDPMHDVLEGLCPINIMLVLLGLISHGKVTVKIINERLDMFVFSKCDVSAKPPHIPTDFVRFSRLTGSASQNWCLFRNLPFIQHD
jgi:hypothetical protein